ncbi:hypothetical protein EVAR_75949_1 [Eumeta japonica]|uniref:Uncharacterized protein n=1 Tax=Eumeta variegata TaxID=151549 RepID=A0A4C1UWB3_EUMVA|nr:hypothetical protein EVAR_75949_1 [Eumeta japonica]
MRVRRLTTFSRLRTSGKLNSKIEYSILGAHRKYKYLLRYVPRANVVPVACASRVDAESAADRHINLRRPRARRRAAVVNPIPKKKSISKRITHRGHRKEIGLCDATPVQRAQRTRPAAYIARARRRRGTARPPSAPPARRRTPANSPTGPRAPSCAAAVDFNEHLTTYTLNVRGYLTTLSDVYSIPNHEAIAVEARQRGVLLD